ncbi:MAG: tripartite tricarboxylate transporter TctB family protein [Deltaproteobacteria bacterium]|nr:tripartite tricarboxylate transporter TctB family protein [Deltaproteobacteria bacterium]MBW2154500.1 tripartite tricarboxylate transporter TctB family protein [Deltaproteobacteria bacterium]
MGEREKIFSEDLLTLFNMLRNKNIHIPVIFIACAVFFFVVSFWIPTVEFEASQISPRFFPQMLLSTIVLLNILLIFQSRKKKEGRLSTKEPVHAHTIRFFGTITAVILFVILFNWVGAYFAIFLFMLGFLFIWEVRNPLTLILTPFLTSLGVYLVFHKLLEVRLPKGIFGSFL